MEQQTDQLPYKDASLPVDDRVEDLLSRMTLEEKAGQLFHTMFFMLDDSRYEEGGQGDKLITDKLLTHLNLLGNVKDARRTAEFLNKAQSRAMATRLAIPITFSTDPRHSFTQNLGTGFNADAFSQWPETLGLAAVRDAELVHRFADIARQEYLAVGLRCALSPQIDLSTDPRWARTSGTFGEDADLTSELLVPYIKGFQKGNSGVGIGSESVTTVTKHFPGAGAKENGEDAHFDYGKNQVYPGGQFDYHLAPFKAAIAAGTTQMMPYYSKPVGTEYEEIGFGFNRQIVTDLLRDKLGFDGIVLTDWSLLTDDFILGGILPARAWGAEDLTVAERIVKILDAGCDQFGGESETEALVKTVRDGLVTEARLDVSVRKLLKEKFLLGLFEKPYVDPEKANFAGNEQFKAAGFDAQRRSLTLLTNNDNILPLRPDTLQKGIYVEGIESSVLEARGLKIAPTPEQASIALLKIDAPYRERTTGFEKLFRAGSLEYTSEEKQRQAKIYATVPTIVDVKLDRPAAIPEIAEQAAALLASYGSSPDALLDVILGKASPEGALPFDLPRSDAAVAASKEDTPYDTKDPVFKFGHGLRYSV